MTSLKLRALMATILYLCAGSCGGAEWIYSDPVGIDLTRNEITVVQFKACVENGACMEEIFRTKSDDLSCNWDYPDRDNHPMNCVDWYGARDFCEWIGGILPKEDEEDILQSLIKA